MMSSRNFVYEKTPMNQKELAQAKQKGKTVQLLVDNKLLQHNHSISALCLDPQEKTTRHFPKVTIKRHYSW